MSDEIAEIQSELQAVKKALRDGGAHMGMTGESLQQYFLQLNEKENLVMSRELQAMQLSSSAGPETNAGALLRGASGQDFAQVGAAASVAEAGSLFEAVAPAAIPPEGPTSTFDREDLASVLGHLAVYESSAPESSKALRALSSLAYANASGVGGDDRVLKNVLRACDLHPTEEVIWLPAMRVVCNMAYDSEVALGRLSEIPVLTKIVGGLAKGGDTGAKASEAIARIVAAEVGPPESDDGPRAVRPEHQDGSGPISSLFVAAVVGDSSWQTNEVVGNTTKRFATDLFPNKSVLVSLLFQLVTSEVVGNKSVAERFVLAAPACAAQNAMGSARWMQMAKQLATGNDMGQALVECDAIKACVDLMAQRVADGIAQLAGMEAMSALVGDRWMGLQAFANAKGIMRIEAAMQHHSDDAVLQTKAMRSLASGVHWPEDMQKKSGYNPSTGLELTKKAMAEHMAIAELQVAALESLMKYLGRITSGCVDKVKEHGGEDLVKTVMVKHPGSDQPMEVTPENRIQAYGRQVLDRLGTGEDWNPRQWQTREVSAHYQP